MSAELLRAGDFDQCEWPDIYFSTGYGLADARTQRGEWRTVVAFDGRWQLPLVLRPLTGGYTDAASPYGYSGVYAHPTLTVEDVETCWSATRDLLMREGIVSVFLRHSPLVHQAKMPDDAVSVIEGHKTRYMPMGDPEELWAGMEGRCRTSIRKARNLGLTTSIRQCTAYDLASGSAFRELYEDAMIKRGASSFYRFPDEYYDALLHGLGSALMIGIVSAPDGTPLASSLFLQHPEFLHYHLSGACKSGARMGATNLLLWAAIELSADLGVKGLHLGGGMENGDSLYKFKRSFGGEDREFRASGLVVDATTYRRLASGSREDAAYFPAYRAPMVPQ